MEEDVAKSELAAVQDILTPETQNQIQVEEQQVMETPEEIEEPKPWYGSKRFDIVD